MKPDRRTYYDHELVYRRIAEKGGRGWDDRVGPADQGSYCALDWFLSSGFCPNRPHGLKALDLGCGGGQVALRLALMGFQVTGIDFSETAIELAKRNATDEGLAIDFAVGDCLDLSQIDDGEFDIVVDNHVLHCLIGPEDRGAFLKTARRVLKAGGIFFSETMSAEGTIDMAALGINPSTRIDTHHSRYWVTVGELQSEFDFAGWETLHRELRSQSDHPSAGDTIVTVARHARIDLAEK